MTRRDRARRMEVLSLGEGCLGSVPGIFRRVPGQDTPVSEGRPGLRCAPPGALWSAPRGSRHRSRPCLLLEPEQFAQGFEQVVAAGLGLRLLGEGADRAVQELVLEQTERLLDVALIGVAEPAVEPG